MSGLSNADGTANFLNSLNVIELRTWDNYFPKEMKHFSKLLGVVNKLRREGLSNIPAHDILHKIEGLLIVNASAYKTAFEKIDLKPYQNQLAVQKVVGAFIEFYPQFLNSYVLEITNADELGTDERLCALCLIREFIEKESLLFNVNMFSHFRVTLNYINEKLPQLEIQRKEIGQVFAAVQQQIEAEDFYYWPLRIEKAENFWIALESYKLIAPGQDSAAAFQEKADPKNQIVWIGQNKQLIYLLFLLYRNQRNFKGVGIHEIACHVFKHDSGLQPRSLNNQLLKIINPNNNLVRREVIDESLIIIEDLIGPLLL